MRALTPRRAAALLVTAVAACSNGSSGDPAAFCARIEDQSRFERVIGKGLDFTNPGRVKQQLDTIERQLRELRADAPGELKDDISVLLDAVGEIQEAAEDGSTEALREAQTALEDEQSDIESANADLETYRQTTCATVTTRK